MKKANKCTAGVVKTSLELLWFSLPLIGSFSGMISPACERHARKKVWNNHISDVLKAKECNWWRMYYVPSWRLSLKTEIRKVALVMANPKETRKWKDQRGIWANCVATNGDMNAPRPENMIFPMNNNTNRMKKKTVVTICCLKNSQFCLSVVLQSRYESIRLSVLIVFFSSYIKYMGKSRNFKLKVTYQKNHAYSIDEIRHHEDRKRGCRRFDRVRDHL